MTGRRIKRFLGTTTLYAVLAMLAQLAFGQAPAKVRFVARPFPTMSVHISAEGSASYVSDQLVVNLDKLRLTDHSLDATAFAASIGLSAYTLDNKPLGDAKRVDLRKQLAKGGELQFENIRLVVPMDPPPEQFIFFLAVYMPSRAFWISDQVAVRGLRQLDLRVPPR